MAKYNWVGAGARRRRIRMPFSWKDGLEMFVVIALLGLLVMAVNKIRSPELFPVRKIHSVSRLQHVGHSELRQAVLSKMQGGFFSVNLQDIEMALEKLPWVDKASVRRQWPDTLLIKVDEQLPIARWGKEGLVNSRGELFYPRAHFSRELCVLLGPDGQQKALLLRFKQLQKMLFSVGIKLHTLILDKRRAWHLQLANGIPVAVGRHDVIKRVKRFTQIYSTVLTPRVENIARIDLRYTNGLAVAWKLGGLQQRGETGN